MNIVIADSSLVQRTNKSKYSWNVDSLLAGTYTIKFYTQSKLPSLTDLHRRPAIVPRNLVPAKLLLSISITDIRVDIVVIKNPAFNRIVVDTLSTRRVNIVMRLENNGSTAGQTRRASSIDLQTTISTYLTSPVWFLRQLTNSPVAEDDLQTLILYSAPGAGRSVSR